MKDLEKDKEKLKKLQLVKDNLEKLSKSEYDKYVAKLKMKEKRGK